MPQDNEDLSESSLQRLQDEELNELSEFVKNLLKIARQETVERIISTMILSGLTVSDVAEGLASVCHKRGNNKATGLLEQASLLLQEDEP
jgi:hypothetical protein